MFTKNRGNAGVVIGGLAGCCLWLGACSGLDNGGLAATPDGAGLGSQLQDSPADSNGLNITPADSTGNSNSSVDLDTALRDIAALEAPADVDAEVFAELKASLQAALVSRQAGDQQAFGRETSAGTYFDSEQLYHDLYNGRARLSYVEGSWKVTSEFHHQADYDQNGVVGVSDIVPLSMHLGRKVEGSSYLAHLDGNHNGYVEYADVVPIAQRFGKRMRKLRLYASNDITDYPWDAGAAQQPALPALAYLDIAAKEPQEPGQLDVFRFGKSDYGSLSPGNYRYLWTVPDDEPTAGQLCPVRRNLNEIREDRLSYDPQSHLLEWESYLHGDLYGDGMITLYDLTAVGLHLNESVPLGERYITGVDGNRDGHIGFADVGVIGAFLNHGVTGYRLYLTDDPDNLPVDGITPQSMSPHDSFSFEAKLGNPFMKDTPEYIEWNAALPDSNHWRRQDIGAVPSGSWIWLAPLFDNGSTPGPASEVLYVE